MGTIRAVAVRPGTAQDVVELRPTTLGARPAGTVRVRMRAATVNPSDLVTISGAYPSRTTFPFVGGFEGVGEVVAAGADPRLAVGTRVLPIRRAGCWAELRDIPEDDCVPVPWSLTTDQACFAFVNPLTALSMVDQFVAGPTPVVVSAASSTIADQLAALLATRGVPVVGVVRDRGSMPRRPWLWTDVIDASRPAWGRWLRAALPPTGCDLVLDAVGGPQSHELAGALRTGGRFVSYGLLSGLPVGGSRGLRDDITLTYFHLRRTVHTAGSEELQSRFREAFDLVARGVLGTEPAARFPLRAVSDALRWNASHPGKVLIDIAE